MTFKDKKNNLFDKSKPRSNVNLSNSNGGATPHGRASNPFLVSLDDLPDSNFLSTATRYMPRATEFFISLIERLLGLKSLADLYNELPLSSFEQQKAVSPLELSNTFIRNTLKILDVSYSVHPNYLDRIPPSGPLVIVCNHPFGALEALILGEIVRSVRSDAKFLANYMLQRIPQLKDLFILVDPFETKGSATRNIQPLREAMQHLNAGHCVITFPAGTVSHLHLAQREVVDPKWSNNIARLIKTSKARVLPFFIHGRNPAYFQLAGLIHPLIRTALLPRQLLNKKNSHITVQVGKLIPFEKLSHFSSNQELINYLRIRTYVQKNSRLSNASKKSFFRSPNKAPQVREPLAEPENADVIFQEITSLPEDRILIRKGLYLVACAQASEIPVLLKEIGRLREEAFRDVGEGTGKATDLDWYDNYYEHLFCWHTQKKEIVGAYRIARSDEVIKRYGVKGLYTHSLFNYSEELLNQLGYCLEMGRSFVCTKYQKNFWPLLLLWNGIGKYVACHPQYKTLFGPVSISDSFDSMSRHLMITFLKSNNFESNLARYVQPKKRAQSYRLQGIDQKQFTKVVRDISEVSELVSDIELQEESVPVLLREYLKLGGKLIGFNIDSQFSSVLDGLIVVDLTRTKVRLLKRYLGKQETEKFLSFHNITPPHDEEVA